MLFLSSASFSLSLFVSFYFAPVWLFPPDPPLFLSLSHFSPLDGCMTSLSHLLLLFLLFSLSPSCPPPSLSLSQKGQISSHYGDADDSVHWCSISPVPLQGLFQQSAHELFFCSRAHWLCDAWSSNSLPARKRILAHTYS